MLKGIDLSYWQKDNYRSLVDQYGKDFVIVRAAWRYSVDSVCDSIYQYAKSKGKKLGFYFFPLTSDGEPEKHAEWAYKQVLGYIGEAIPILDWEAYSSSDGVNNVGKTDWALRWLKKFEELSGVKPMIYMNSSCNSSYNFQSIVNNNNGLWIANYGINNGIDHGVPDVNWWGFAAMHQYTSLLNGSSLDGNTFYGDKQAWDKYAKSNKQGKPVAKPSSQDSDKIKSLENQIKNLEATIKRLKTEKQEESKSYQICSKNLESIKSTYSKLVKMMK